MSLKFSANLNFLFTENGSTTLQRFRLARQAGFKAVETGFGADVSVEDAAAVQRETGLEVALLNISLGKRYKYPRCLNKVHICINKMYSWCSAILGKFVVLETVRRTYSIVYYVQSVLFGIILELVYWTHVHQLSMMPI